MKSALFKYLGIVATLPLLGSPIPRKPTATVVAKKPTVTVMAFALSDRAGVRSLSEHAVSVDVVSPQCYVAHPNGKVTGHISPDLLKAARGRTQMMPSVVNEDFSTEALSDLLQSRAARDRLTKALVTVAKRDHLRGFVIDFEGLGRSNRDHYTAFLKAARIQMHKAGLRLGVAIPPPLGSYRDSFDHAAIGRVADVVVVMAYDQHSRNSPPGPIAGYNWVERAVETTVAVIPPGKLLLGVPLYHRKWNETGSTAGSHQQALSLLTESGAELQWDTLSRSPWFKVETVEASNTVWLENSRSVAEKLEIARRYKLAGVAAWRLGQEDPEVWDVLVRYKQTARRR